MLAILKKAFWFVIDNWKIVVPAVVILVGCIWVYRACNRPPKLNEKEIQKAQTAIAKQDREEMVKILAESEVRETAIDTTLQQAERATEDAKRNYNRLTNEELAAELERRSKE